MSFSVHATAFLFDLRVIRRLLEYSQTVLHSTDDVATALEFLNKIITRIEDVDAFLQAIEDQPAPPETGLEPASLQRDAEQRHPWDRS